MRFSIYAALVLTKFPEQALSLLAYQLLVAKLSQKYWWPSWAIYDNAFRQHASENAIIDWSRTDPSLHTTCFEGMAISSEG